MLKICIKCNNLLELDKFVKNNNKIKNYCKVCDCKAARERREKNRIRNKLNNFTYDSPKKCYKCKQFKNINEFAMNLSTTDNHSSCCKLCDARRAAEYRKIIKNSPKIVLNDNKICRICKIKKIIEEFGKNSRTIDGLEYVCKKCRCVEAKSYRAKYSDRVRITRRNHDRKRRKYDINYRLRKAIAARLRAALKGGYQKGMAIKELGCSVDFFKKYLENQFQLGMSWDNYGNKLGQWSIDHIIPISLININDKNSIQKICHHTNLRPMWHSENVRKSNKLIII